MQSISPSTTSERFCKNTQFPARRAEDLPTRRTDLREDSRTIRVAEVEEGEEGEEAITEIETRITTRVSDAVEEEVEVEEVDSTRVVERMRRRHQDRRLSKSSFRTNSSVSLVVLLLAVARATC